MKRFFRCFKKAFLRLQRWAKFRDFVYFGIKDWPFLWLFHKRRSLNFGFWETQKTTKIMLFLIIHSDETVFEMLQKSTFTTTKMRKVSWFCILWYQKNPFLWLLHKRRSLIFGFWETQKTTKIMLFLIIHSDEMVFEMLQKSTFTTTKLRKVSWFCILWYHKKSIPVTFAQA